MVFTPARPARHIKSLRGQGGPRPQHLYPGSARPHRTLLRGPPAAHPQPLHLRPARNRQWACRDVAYDVTRDFLRAQCGNQGRFNQGQFGNRVLPQFDRQHQRFPALIIPPNKVDRTDEISHPAPTDMSTYAIISGNKPTPSVISTSPGL